MKRTKFLRIIIVSIFLCITIFPAFANEKVINTNATSRLQQGQELYQLGKYKDSIELLKQAEIEFRTTGDRLNEAITLSNLSLAYQQFGDLQNAEKFIIKSLKLLQNQNSSILENQTQILAQALDVQGRLKFVQGKADIAINIWKEAANIYMRLDDKSALVRNRINQAQAFQALGNLWQANKILGSVKESLENLPDSHVKAIGFISLGNIHRLVGDFDKSELFLKKSIELADKLQLNKIQSNAYFHLGNTFRGRRDNLLSVGENFNTEKTDLYTKEAIKNYQKAIQITSNSPSIRLQAMLNQLSLLVNENKGNLLSQADLNNSDGLLNQIQSLIPQIPNSRAAIYNRINFAKNLSEITNNEKDRKRFQELAYSYTKEAVILARELGDKRAESYALGSYGEVYEKAGQLNDAKKITEQALAISASVDNKDIAYQWQWQLGRLENKLGNFQEAIKTYGLAIETLDSLRNDLVAINTDVQFSFREKVEPVYREYVSLLLRGKEQDNLIKARKVIESLQLAELNNFLRVACLKASVNIDNEVDTKATKAAIIYPIVLPDRIEIILKLPEKKELIKYTSYITEAEIESKIKEISDGISEKFYASQIPALKIIYNHLLGHAESYLKSNKVETLIFVLDGVLRDLPIAALYDGKNCLIEKYNIALSPTLQLFELKKITKLKVLTAGLSEKNQNFEELEHVRKELDKIESTIEENKELYNQNFTKKNLENNLNSEPFSIVHIATHGQFSSDPNETFILAHKNEKIKLNDLKQWLRSREELRPDAIELLVLSACNTATGDKRAVLGIAGVSIQAGARSAIASLWQVNDYSTASLMGKFYQELATNKVSKAEALRRAQLDFLKQDNQEYKKPYYWAPFILIGSWL
jgi:CHAT domain-containing protein